MQQCAVQHTVISTLADECRAASKPVAQAPASTFAQVKAGHTVLLAQHSSAHHSQPRARLTSRLKQQSSAAYSATAVINALPSEQAQMQTSCPAKHWQLQPEHVDWIRAKRSVLHLPALAESAHSDLMQTTSAIAIGASRPLNMHDAVLNTTRSCTCTAHQPRAELHTEHT
jgi:hypothetical protein